MNRWFSGKAPIIDWSKIEQKPDQATRAASANCLSLLAKQVDNMIVSSADLSNSDKTDGFLKQTHALTRNDFSGAFLRSIMLIILCSRFFFTERTLLRPTVQELYA